MLNVLFTIGVIWFIFGVITKTENPASSLAFKVLPMLSGGFTMYFAAAMLNWI